MRSSRAVLTFAVAVLVLGAARLSAQDVKLAEEKPGLAAKAKVTYQVALASAQARIPKGKLATAELEEEDGKLIYTLVFKTEGKKGQDEVNVDAATGRIVAVEHEKSDSDAKESRKEEKKEVKKEVKKGGN
jgi:uncharacterized membrane protein YkoI